MTNPVATFLKAHDLEASALARELDYSKDQIRRMARGDIPVPRVVSLALQALPDRCLWNTPRGRYSKTAREALQRRSA
jgi:hypothetical protein